MANASRYPKKNPRSSFSSSIAMVATSIALSAWVVFATAKPVDLTGRSADAVQTASTQERGPSATSATEIRGAIDHLADIDYASRVKAARLIRRSAAAQTVPALLEAISGHKDGFVRFRSLVLLTGFNDARAVNEMLQAMASPNDRLRDVAYGYFELHPDPAMAPRLLAGLEKEKDDFVRPSIIRALAAIGDEPAVRDALLRDITRGVDFFRSTVIEAMGDYKRSYALPKLLDVVKLDGPLQDDAAIAIGRLGDKQALAVLAELQRKGGKELQPTLAAAICLLGVNCSSHLGYLEKVLAFAEDNPGYQELVRPAAAGLAAVGVNGNADAIRILFERGVDSMDPMRAAMALAAAKVAIRNTALTLSVLEKRTDQAAAIDLIAEGFDMLEEDLEEEQFFVAVRKGYWAAPDSSATRKLAEQLITKLNF